MGIGNLGADPTIRSTDSQGRPVMNFNIAIDDFYYKTTETGTVKEKITTWVPCVVWGSQATHLAKYLQKGSKIAVQGRLSSRTYEKEGQTHHVLECTVDKVSFIAGIKGNEAQVAQAQAE